MTADDPWADRHLDIGDGELDALIAAGPRFALALAPHGSTPTSASG
jgi:hypothetical protein